MQIPNNVKQILKDLQSSGYEGYVVGGAVRDYVMNIEPHDWDVATNATPEQVKSVFSKTFDSGIKHGTVTALVGDEPFEITTYRSDGLYSDGRHPDAVSFVNTIEEDLARRDFTINAMAMDINGHIIDPYGGQEDIKRGLIRCVGNPDQRFNEDALRMMRAVRFESKFDFDLEPETKQAINRNVDKLKSVSSERIREEYTKILTSQSPKKGFLDAYEVGITAVTLPEFNRMMECEQRHPSHYANVGEHSLDTVEYIRPDANLRWAMLLHDVGKPDTKGINPKNGYDSFYGHPERSEEIARGILNRLKFSNADKKEVLGLVKFHDYVPNSDYKKRVFGAKFGADFVRKLGEVKMADAEAHTPEYAVNFVETNRAFVRDVIGFIEDGTAIQPSGLKIDGNELKEIGLEGKEIGRFIRNAHRDCLAQPNMNTNELLRKRAERHIERLKQAEERTPKESPEDGIEYQ